MIKTSFFSPIAFNCRSKMLLYDKSFDIAEITLRSVASDIDLIGHLFFSNRQTNSAAKCDESEADPPFPQLMMHLLETLELNKLCHLYQDSNHPLDLT